MSVSNRVLVVQHAECETLGTIERALRKCGLVPHYLPVHEGQHVPANLGDEAALIVMGGPMSVYDYGELTHLMQEMRLIGSALGLHRPVLGVCLGSQLLAHVLGSKVRPGAAKEIGWHQVTLSDSAIRDPLWSGAPQTFQAFHWHGDIFDLPTKSECLASSEMTSCQAFRHGTSAYGILYHMEATESMIDGMAVAFPDELAQVGGNLESLRQGAKRHLREIAAIGERFFGGWARLAAEGVTLGALT